jgi:hypothetical protein
MNGPRSLLATLVLVACALMLSACFGSSSSGPPAPIAVQFSVLPPTSVNLDGSFQVTAIVTNGPSNAMVNWSCIPTGACGSFQPAMTASGSPTTYTAPMTAPAGNSVTISAVSANDMTKSATANVTIGQPAVTFNPPAPPPSLATNANVQVSATITSTVPNEVSDGLDWTAACTNSAGGGCGMFSPAHTNSGAATTYSPPTTVPATGVAVRIKAASTLNPGDNVTAVINVSTIQSSAFLCANCTYTYTVSGENANGPFSVAGVFTTDGMGNITGGEQDFSDLSFSTGNLADTIETGSGYQFTSDGRGTIILITNDPNIGVSNGTTGTETFGVAFVSANHALITEMDTSATASGTMDLQTLTSFSQSTLNGGYTFVAGGATIPTPLISAQPLGFGGVFVVASGSPGTISTTSGTSDANLAGCTSTMQGFGSGSGYGVPDSLGRVQITLRLNFIGDLDNKCGFNFTGPVILDAYITDATHLKFVEADPTFGVTGGLAVGQGAKTGMLGSASQLPANTSYVFTAFGAIPIGPVALATTFTSDGSANLQNGSSDVSAAGLPSSGSVSGTYSVDSAGTGRVAVSLKGNTIVGSPNTADNFAVYLTGGADPPMALEVDQYGVTTGTMYTQAAGPFSLASFQGNYGLNFTLFGFDSANQTYDIEDDISGQAFADGAGNLLGTLDINASGSPQPNVSLSGSYASSASGRFTGSITLNTTPATTLGLSYFIISPTQLVIIETDNTAVSLGLFQAQSPPF